MKTTTHTIAQSHSSTVYTVDVTPKATIRVRTTQYRMVKGDDGKIVSEPVDFDKTFRIGDLAEYNSYNMSYYGEITAIGPKSVTIVAYRGTSGERTYRLSLERFSWRNYDFDVSVARERNHDVMMHC